MTAAHVVFTEQGEGGGAEYGSYIRPTSGGPAVRREAIPRQVSRQDLQTGAREPFLELMPASLAGLINIGPVFVIPDGSACLHSYRRYLSTLYLGDDPQIGDSKGIGYNPDDGVGG